MGFNARRDSGETADASFFEPIITNREQAESDARWEAAQRRQNTRETPLGSDLTTVGLLAAALIGLGRAERLWQAPYDQAELSHAGDTVAIPDADPLQRIAFAWMPEAGDALELDKPAPSAVADVLGPYGLMLGTAGPAPAEVTTRTGLTEALAGSPLAMPAAPSAVTAARPGEGILVLPPAGDLQSAVADTAALAGAPPASRGETATQVATAPSSPPALAEASHDTPAAPAIVAMVTEADHEPLAVPLTFAGADFGSSIATSPVMEAMLTPVRPSAASRPETPASHSDIDVADTTPRNASTESKEPPGHSEAKGDTSADTPPAPTEAVDPAVAAVPPGLLRAPGQLDDHGSPNPVWGDLLGDLSPALPPGLARQVEDGRETIPPGHASAVAEATLPAAAPSVLPPGLARQVEDGRETIPPGHATAVAEATLPATTPSVLPAEAGHETVPPGQVAAVTEATVTVPPGQVAAVTEATLPVTTPSVLPPVVAPAPATAVADATAPVTTPSIAPVQADALGATIETVLASFLPPGLAHQVEAGRETIPPGHAADFAEAILTAPALAHPDAVL